MIGDSIELDRIVDTGNGFLLPPKQYAVILDGSYFGNSNIYNGIIPDNSLILAIDDGSFGRSGWSNKSVEPVILKDSLGEIIQKYFYSIGNDPGYSDEKIILNEDNSKNNWSNSKTFRGTPGKLNSVTPFQWDVKIDTIWTEPAYLIQDSSFVLMLQIYNSGLNTINQMHLTIYEDLNDNFVLDVNEIIFLHNIYSELHWNNSIIMKIPLEGLSFGSHRLGALIELDFEQNKSDNHRIFLVDFESLEPSIVINEIMFQPRVGLSEWMELFNVSDGTVNLAFWYIADAKDTVSITSEEMYLPRNEYVILCGDSSTTFDYDVNFNKVIVVTSFPILNNDTDKLKLISSSGRIIDYINYSKTWMNREVVPGTSLERVNPKISAHLSENWGASIDPSGSTPGRVNSLFIEKRNSTSIISVSPNPFSPDGDGFEDVTLIQYNLRVATALLSIDIFDIVGRNIRHLATQIPIASIGSIIWDGRDDQGRVARIGFYVILIRIQNSYLDFFEERKTTVILVKN